MYLRFQLSQQVFAVYVRRYIRVLEEIVSFQVADFTKLRWFSFFGAFPTNFLARPDGHQ